MIKDNLYPQIVAQEETPEEPSTEETVDQEENPMGAPAEGDETPSEGGEETPAEGGEETPAEAPAEGGEETPAEGGEETPAEENKGF